MKHDQKFMEWLRNQPKDGTYDWPNPSKCLMGRFLGEEYYKSLPYTDFLENYYEISAPRPWTFGAALERCESNHGT